MRGEPLVIRRIGEEVGAEQDDAGWAQGRQKPLVVVAQHRALLQADEEAMAESLRSTAEIEFQIHCLILCATR